MLRGVRPFLSSKFDIIKHSKYKYLSAHGKKYAFDVRKYLELLRRPSPLVAPNEPFDFYEIEDEPGDIDAIGKIEAE